VSAAIAYLVFLGPVEVLLPFVVKNELHARPGTLGWFSRPAGAGAVARPRSWAGAGIHAVT
jgi:hypothetical protein